MRPSAETSPPVTGWPRPRFSVPAWRSVPRATGVHLADAAVVLGDDRQRAAARVDQQRLRVVRAVRVVQRDLRRRGRALAHAVDRDVGPLRGVVADVADVERAPADGDVLPVDRGRALEGDLAGDRAGPREMEQARAVAGVVVGPEAAARRAHEARRARSGRSPCPSTRTLSFPHSAGGAGVATGRRRRRSPARPPAVAWGSRPRTRRGRRAAISRYRCTGSEANAGRGTASRAQDDDLAAALRRSDVHDAALDLRQRARAVVLDVPGGAAHGRRGVLAGGAELALAVAPQAALLDLLARRRLGLSCRSARARRVRGR